MNSGKSFYKIFAVALAVFTLLICFSACGNPNTAPVSDDVSQPEATSQNAYEQTTAETTVPPAESKQEETQSETSKETEEEPAVKTLIMKIGNTTVAVDWEDNESVAALRELVKDKPLTVQMSMYGGFEQVGSLGTSLPRNDSQTTTAAGDIVLYSGNQIVVFYGSNSWASTRLGHINLSKENITELLSHNEIIITIKYQ